MSLTEQQVNEIIQEVIANLRERQASYLLRAIPLSSAQRASVQGFFPEQLLNEVRVLELRNERVPNPAFQKRAQMRGYRMMLDFSHMAAIIHPQLIIFQEEPYPRVLFHSLVHVVQYAILGLERYLELYVRAFVKTGNYASVPLEAQAFHLARRYTEYPNRIFSVKAEVENWIEDGRYNIQAAVHASGTPPRIELLKDSSV